MPSYEVFVSSVTNIGATPIYAIKNPLNAPKNTEEIKIVIIPKTIPIIGFDCVKLDDRIKLAIMLDNESAHNYR